MKKISIIATLYAILLIVGGLVGYLQAKSLPSLIASGLSGLLMFFSSYLMNRENVVGYYLSLALSTLLLLFFIYRFQITFKFMPAGLMIMLSGFFIGYALLTKKNDA